MTTRRTFLKTTIALPLAAASTQVFAASHAAHETHVVEIRSFKFSPDNLTIKAGDSVTFINRDGAPHTATANDKSWTTKNLRKNKEETIQFNEKGTHPYFCRIHPNMKGSLTVA